MKVRWFDSGEKNRKRGGFDQHNKKGEGRREQEKKNRWGEGDS